MSGFESWIASAPAALVVLDVCALLGGAGIGAWWGFRRGWDHAYENMRWERAQAKARRTHPVYRVRPPEVAHEWPDSQVRTAATEPGWPGSTPTTSLPSPLALTRGDPITTGEIAAITPRMEKFLEELFAVPYSADELWSGQ